MLKLFYTQTLRFTSLRDESMQCITRYIEPLNEFLGEQKSQDTEIVYYPIFISYKNCIWFDIKIFENRLNKMILYRKLLCIHE